MQKKLLAVAVAGALAAPGAALAASSVTITGYFQVSYAPISKVSGKSNNDSQDRVQDESSRIWFRVVEDLGGGLQAIGQVDWRVTMDAGADGTNGANWVGFRSKSWGDLTMGRHDLHYIYTEDQSYSRGGSLKMTNTSVIAYSAGGVAAVAIASRTPNTIVWDSPNWSGFTAKVAYSTNPYAAAEGELGNSASGGYAWNIAPQYNAKNWGIGYSYYQGKNDGGAFNIQQAGSAVVGTISGQFEGKSHRVNGHYQWGGLRIGVVWDRSEWDVKDQANKAALAALGFGSQISKRDAWSIPIRYSWGKWNVFGHYTWADDDDAQIWNGINSGAKMWAIGGSYDFSKRTSVGLSWAQISNDNGAAYNLFTSASGLGSPDASVAPGEDPKQLAITVKHSF